MEYKNQSWFEKRREIAKEKDKLPASQAYKGAFWASVITTVLYIVLTFIYPAAIFFWIIFAVGEWVGYFVLTKFDSYVGDVIAAVFGFLFGKLLFFYSIFSFARRYRHNKYLATQN